MQQYTKENLLGNIRTFDHIFLGIIFSSNVTFSGLEDLGIDITKLNVNASIKGEECIISGENYKKLIGEKDLQKEFINLAGVYARSNYCITIYERLKTYCSMQKNSSNYNAFFSPKDEYKDLINMLRILRVTSTHWNTGDNIIEWKPCYGDSVSFLGVEIKKGMRENELPVTNKILFELSDSIQVFIEKELE